MEAKLPSINSRIDMSNVSHCSYVFEKNMFNCKLEAAVVSQNKILGI
jgi:hypothetical protein